MAFAMGEQMKESTGYRPLDRYEHPDGSGRVCYYGVYYPELAYDPPHDAVGNFVRIVPSGKTLLREVIGIYARTHFFQRRLPNGRWVRIQSQESRTPMRLVK